jgi:hypothetical protein
MPPLQIAGTVLLILAYLAGAVTSLILGLRKAGLGAWLALAAFGLLACEAVSDAAFVIFARPVILRRFVFVRALTLAPCVFSGLAVVAVALLIVALVSLSRHSTPAA